MTCPKCNSEHTMSTTRTETFSVVVTVLGRPQEQVDEEKNVKHRCLDCGAEWEG